MLSTAALIAKVLNLYVSGTAYFKKPTAGGEVSSPTVLPEQATSGWWNSAGFSGWRNRRPPTRRKFKTIAPIADCGEFRHPALFALPIMTKLEMLAG
ncbi:MULTISPECIES: hypothetical protein [unclassified Ensifer]|uniref:hypothetical protein n=1 Tax=unclassified Ensifer TaxID=2633371 RepID=UPI0008130990|nr:MULTISPECIES: hypothetical protein [unclassified Ensifer]OCP08354.1 hypothetical protein BBX50_19800 [Ensifer sp. LC11]OCP08968.1 hypothetical protein BC374_19590 [Ensifer sp. LC13]OCP09752.1 hypothetical protein BC362_08365 [Ensifer sp. LC14]OCP32340.1 hypothetical protein BC364_19590 [Ensifer sp. LC499]